MFYINHGVIPAFLDSLLGWADVANGQYIIRELPDAHPVYSNYYCMEASVEGIGVKEGQLQYNGIPIARSQVAKITGVYKSADFEVIPDQQVQNEMYRFVSRTMNFSGEFFTINATGMRFVSNVGSDGEHKALAIPPARITGVSELTYIWRLVPGNPSLGLAGRYVTPNMGRITSCLGKVNSLAFDPDVANLPAGTVIFLGAEPKLIAPRITTGQIEDNIFWEIMMKFLYRNNGFVNRTTDGQVINEQAGHNFLWDQGKEWWDLITHNGLSSGTRLYQTADLNSLFSIG